MNPFRYSTRHSRPSGHAIVAALCVMIFGISGCAGSSATNSTDNLNFVPIFNGEDLSGWRIDRIEADEDLQLFTVENGELILDTPGTEEFAWLTYEEELTDFVLRLEFVAYQDARGNCGIQFRDEWADDQWYGRHGLDLASNVPHSTGFIWDFEEGWLPPLGLQFNSESFLEHLPEEWTYKWSTDADPWNTLELTVIGDHVRSVLNGVEIIDWDGGDYIQPEGHIAIEVHNGQVFRFKFRNIELADLSS